MMSNYVYAQMRIRRTRTLRYHRSVCGSLIRYNAMLAVTAAFAAGRRDVTCRPIGTVH